MAVTQFLGTELDVLTSREPTPLIEMLATRRVHVVGRPAPRDDGHWFVELELRQLEVTADTTVLAILDAIEALTGEAREIWYVAPIRELDLRFQCGASPRAFSDVLSSSTLARATAAGVSIRFTLYAAGGAG